MVLRALTIVAAFFLLLALPSPLPLRPTPMATATHP